VTITSAILEFLVIGCLWICVFVLAILILLAGYSGSWPLVNLENSEAVITLLGIPLAYAVGVVLQAATWRFWYKRIHRKALRREMASSHKEAYQRLAQILKSRGVKIGLEKDLIETGSDLGGLLDVLRWELLTSPQSEPAKQYLVQFHLYRILYGSIPPLFSLSLILSIGIWASWRIGSRALGFAFAVAALLSLLLTILALAGAAHRRSRTWKYLVFGVQAQTAERHHST
jgi:hypothetical protein